MSKSKQSESKVVIVTGGGTGIGRAIAEAFLAEGARVVITGRRPEPLESLAKQHDGRVLPVQADLTRAEDRERVVRETVARFGRLDVLVNNAGQFGAGPLEELGDEQAARLFEINVLAPYGLTRAAAKHLEAARGSVVNISSIVATAVNPGLAVYSATKAALDHLTRTLAAELGPRGVRLNTVSPGLTKTDMSAPLEADPATLNAFLARTPLGRIGQPQDIAPVVTFLASTQAGWITGQTVAASGGL